jgi:curli biogenesis system outer membrane secretion channel CsgG
MRRTARLVISGVMLVTLGAGCATTETPPPGPVAIGTPAPSAPVGPKKRVAVVRFENIGAFAQKYGDWDVGGGLAAQLTTALIESGHFIVVERGALVDVLREQEMALEKIVSKETAAKVRQVLGAQLLVKGAVTEFEQEAGGGGLNIGIGLPGIGLGGGGTTVSAHVGIDLRLVDTTTGQVVRSVRAEGKASRSGVAATIDIRNVSIGGDAFKATPLGLATREAIQRAVAAVQSHMAQVAWTGRVMDVIGTQVYINAGQDAAINVGDTFSVSSVVRELTDPETGAVRGVIENPVGQVRVEQVEEKFAVGRMLEGRPPKRGDIVKAIAR